MTRFEPDGSFNAMLAHPEGRFVLYADHLTALEAAVKEIRLEKATEFFASAKIVGEQRNQIAALEAAVKEITDSRDDWKRQWRLMEAAETKAEEQVAVLTAEIARKDEELKKLQEFWERARLTERVNFLREYKENYR